jgi:hypothetical protein
MFNADKIYESTILKWRDNKGIGSIYLPQPLDVKHIIFEIIRRIYSKNDKANMIVVTDCIENKSDITRYLNHHTDNEAIHRAFENKCLKVLTTEYARNVVTRSFDLVVFYAVNQYDLCMASLGYRAKFRLACFTDTPKDTFSIYPIYPKIQGYDNSELVEISLASPVEETRVACIVTNPDEAKLMNEYDEYIQQSISIFGSIDYMNKAIFGDKENNTSSIAICSQIAANNGWSADLDMTIPFNTQIDSIFNPNNLHDRGKITYDVIRKRRELISGNSCKLDEILSIVQKHINKQILVISQNADFANAVCEYVNTNLGVVYAACSHDKLEPIQAVDEQGEPMVIKSGENRGKPKMLGTVAQSHANERLFRNGTIHLLSCSSAPNKELEASIDVLIITSPLCDSVNEYKYRLSKIKFVSNPNIVYRLYCKATFEYKRLSEEQIPNNFNIIVDDKYLSEVSENNGSIICDY